MAIQLPDIGGIRGTGASGGALRRIEEYLITLNEALGYALSHISEENLTDDLVSLIGTAGTDNAAQLGVTGLQRTIAGLGLEVQQGTSQAVLTLKSGETALGTVTLSFAKVKESAADLGAAQALEAAYPVGAVFMSTRTDGELPAVGTWEALEAQPIAGITCYERTE